MKPMELHTHVVQNAAYAASVQAQHIRYQYDASMRLRPLACAGETDNEGEPGQERGNKDCTNQRTTMRGWASTRPNTLAWLRRHSVIRSTHTARQTISRHEHDKVAVAQHSITMTMNEAKTLVNTLTAFGTKQQIIPSLHTHKKAVNRHSTSVQPSNEPHRIQAMQSLAWPATLPLVCW